MVENKTTTKSVFVELRLNSKVYAGVVSVTTDNERIVDLSNILDNGNETAMYKGCNIGFVYDYLKNKALWLAGYTDNLIKCEYTNLITTSDNIVQSFNGHNLIKQLAFLFNDKYYYIGNCETHRLRTSYDDIKEITAPSSYWSELWYCYDCNCYVETHNYYGRDKCIFCHQCSPIDDYSDSHHLTPVLYGDNCDIADFSGFGFELEIENAEKSKTGHNEIAKKICYNAGLDDRELRYAWDGSVHYGFEIISQPHTVKDFWNKLPQWENMLNFLVQNGYISHDSGRCGLHIHVSRNMLGKTENLQDIAIAKIFTFFDDNWEQLVKISRRTYFGYCDKNYLSSYYHDNYKTKYKRWKKQSKRAGGHDRALNNTNKYTFEFRLGRGTLNKWSFFAWIDLILTIAKNAKRITACKVESNDLISWLAGIKETTAKYIYKRGAFKDIMIELYPSIAWETDISDNGN